MSFTDTPFVDGAVMTKAAINSEVGEMRSWLNGSVSLTDVQDGSVLTQKIARPEILGFPVRGISGETQSSWSDSRHEDGERLSPEIFSGTSDPPEKRSSKGQRFDIFHSMCVSSRVPIPGLMKTINISGTGVVTVQAQFSCVEADTRETVVADDADCGYFVVCRAVRGGGAVAATELPITKRLFRYRRQSSHIHMSGTWSLSISGSDLSQNVDFYVAYVKGTAATGKNTHIAIGYRSIRVEFEPT